MQRMAMGIGMHNNGVLYSIRAKIATIKKGLAMSAPINPHLHFLMDAHLVATFRTREFASIANDPQASASFDAVANTLAESVATKYGSDSKTAMEKRSADFAADNVNGDGQGGLKSDIPLIFETEAIVYVEAQASVKAKILALAKTAKP
jgi:hypothetical protein